MSRPDNHEGQPPQEVPRTPSKAELARMSQDELVTLGTRLDSVELVESNKPWPVKGTRGERNAERRVTAWFAFSGLMALAFILIFLLWPWRYNAPPQQGLYEAFTPLLGVTLGSALLGAAGGVISYTKSFIPKEVAIQQRHSFESSPTEKATALAELRDIGEKSTISRRKVVKRSVLTALGLLGVGAVVFPLGGFVRNPWGRRQPREDTLAYTPWHHGPDDEKVFLRKYAGSPDGTEVELIRPGDMDAGAMQTVFPFRESERNDPDKLRNVLTRVDTPVMLIRFKAEDAQHIVKRKGQEDFNYGTYYAYSKICTHLGCPASLYESIKNIALCPCHQSEFDALEYMRPVFGPAARPLPQLPIDVDPETGYLISPHGFIEPIGPGYWERGTGVRDREKPA
jgi:ubiquinol-cytochrome c reductase iron-sulfur subunit